MKNIISEIADSIELSSKESPYRKLWASVVIRSLLDLQGIKSTTNTFQSTRREAIQFFQVSDNSVGSWNYCKEVLDLPRSIDNIINKLIYKYKKLNDSFGLN